MPSRRSSMATTSAMRASSSSTATRAFTPGSARARPDPRAAAARAGRRPRTSGPAPRCSTALERAAVRDRDAPRHREAEPGAARLGGVERLEDPLRLRARECPGPASATSSQASSPAARARSSIAPALLHRLDRVRDQVEQHLREQIGIAAQLAEARVDLAARLDAALAQRARRRAAARDRRASRPSSSTRAARSAARSRAATSPDRRAGRSRRG